MAQAVRRATLLRKKIRTQLLKASGDTSWPSDASPSRCGHTWPRCDAPSGSWSDGGRGGIAAAEIALLAETLPLFAMDSVPGAGHFIHEEQPAAVLAAVQRLRAS